MCQLCTRELRNVGDRDTCGTRLSRLQIVIFTQLNFQIFIKCPRKWVGFILREINGIFRVWQSFNSSVKLYHWYYLLLSSLFRMTVGNGKVPHHYPSFFAAFIRHFYLDCNFIMLYGAYLNQQAWINPLIADFYSLNKINILFFKFCSYVKIVRYSYKIYPTKNEYILAKKSWDTFSSYNCSPYTVMHCVIFIFLNYYMLWLWIYTE